MVFSDRSDGLGERLNCVFNGLLVAKILNAEFRFKWPETYLLSAAFHSLERAKDIFSSDFLDKHLAQADDLLATNGLITCPKGSEESVRSGLALQVSQGTLKTPQRAFIFNLTDRDERCALHAQVVNSLRFTPEISSLLDETHRESSKSESHVVMHVRAGDIVYGRFNESPNFVGKALPLALTVVIARRLVESGTRVKVLGQEPTAIESLTERLGFLPTLSFKKTFDEKDRVLESFFDIAQFGAGESILAGSSGFPRFASQFYLKSLTSPVKRFDPVALMKDVFLELQQNGDVYSLEQKSFTSFFYYKTLDSDDYLISRDLLEQAALYQPENVMYQLWLVLNEIKFKNYKTADLKFSSLLQESVRSGFKDFCKSSLCKLLLQDTVGSPVRCYFPFFEFIKEGASNSSSACKVLEVFIEKTGPLTEEEWLQVSSFI